jgi:hypothetical protein
MANDDDEAPDDAGRRFYRSTREAFPEERGQWFEPPPRDSLWPLYAGAAVCVAMIVLAIAAAWS